MIARAAKQVVPAEQVPKTKSVILPQVTSMSQKTKQQGEGVVSECEELHVADAIAEFDKECNR